MSEYETASFADALAWIEAKAERAALRPKQRTKTPEQHDAERRYRCIASLRAFRSHLQAVLAEPGAEWLYGGAPLGRVPEIAREWSLIRRRIARTEKSARWLSSNEELLGEIEHLLTLQCPKPVRSSPPMPTRELKKLGRAPREKQRATTPEREAMRAEAKAARATWVASRIAESNARRAKEEQRAAELSRRAALAAAGLR